MERQLTALALALGCAIALLLPGVGFWAGYSSMRTVLDVEAEINGRLVTQLVSANPELWTVETLRLGELLRQRSKDKVPERRAVVDAEGLVVIERDDGVGSQVLEARAPIFDAGQPVGILVVQRSLHPLLVHAAGLALLGLLLGFSVFFILKKLPMAALTRARARLQHEATHDALTGLPNRTLFLDRLEQAMSRAHRSQRTMAVLLVDLDHFKKVNDGLGHQVGNEVLRHTARLLDEVMKSRQSPGRRVNDGAYSLARLGSDEFVIVLESAGTAQDILNLGERILDQLKQPMSLGVREVFIGGSVGVALYPQDNTDRDALLHQADIAMSRAKELGRNAVHFFKEELNQAIQHRIGLEHDLRGALARGEFQLYFQPKADFQTGRLSGVEALLRWHRPGEGLVPPDRFIPTLEESRLILPVGAWVLATACEQLAAWDAQGLPAIAMAVNLSAVQFKEPALAEQIAGILQRTGVAPHRLELELTESLLMEDNKLSRETLLGFARLGVRVAVDDFGTGHSSLSYLKRFRVDTLKVDRSFVREIPYDPDNCAIATAVVALAHSMKLSVVCEGIETPEQVAFMRALGCDEIQGFLLARPMPAQAATDWITRYVAGDRQLTAWMGTEAPVHKALQTSLPV